MIVVGGLINEEGFFLSKEITEFILEKRRKLLESR